MQYEVTYWWCKTWQYLHRLFKKNSLPWCTTYMLLQQSSMCEHIYTNCTVNFSNGDMAEMGRKCGIFVYHLLQGMLLGDLCSKCPSEMCHDKSWGMCFWPHSALLMSCFQIRLSLASREFSTSHSKWMIQITRTTLQQMALVTPCSGRE